MEISSNYIVKQLYKPREEKQPIYEGHTATTYLDLKTDYNNIPDISQITTFPSIDNSKGKAGYVDRVQEYPDYQVTSEETTPDPNSIIFYNECIFFDEKFKNDTNYYFHGKIKRMSSSQTFYIKLLIKSEAQAGSTGKKTTQYIKTINVAGGNISEWVDVEFIFSPLTDDFDGIVFELQRDASDYRNETRFAIIGYLELSKIINITEFDSLSPKPIKLGVQSRPGLLMCINGEEIRTGRTGVYEIKNGIIRTNFFAVPHAANEEKEEGQTLSVFEQWRAEVNSAVADIVDREDPSPAHRELYEIDLNEHYVPTVDTTMIQGKNYYRPELINEPTGNPHDSGYCEEVTQQGQLTIYVKTEDTTPVSGKKYYELNIAESITPSQAEKEKEKIRSVEFYKTTKSRTTDSFVLDYMY